MCYASIINVLRNHSSNAKRKWRKASYTHIHVVCADEEVVLNLNGEVLEGSLKSSKMKLVQAWIELHKEELEANWKLLSEGERSFQIEPLR